MPKMGGVHACASRLSSSLPQLLATGTGCQRQQPALGYVASQSVGLLPPFSLTSTLLLHNAPMSRFIPDLGRFSGAEKALRMVLLVAIFGGVIWAFWYNTERTLDRLEQEQRVYDQTKSLTPDQKALIKRFADGLKDEFGMQLKLAIRTDGLEIPDEDSKTLFVGVNPAARELILRFPPLLERAIGEEVKRDFLANQDAFFWGSGSEGDDWREGVVLLLSTIADRLAALQQSETGGGA